MTLKQLKLIFCFCLLSVTSFGQFGYHYYNHHYYRPYSSYSAKGKKGLQKEYISFNLPMMAMDMSSAYVLARPANAGPSVDTAIRWHRASSGSFGFGGGISFNVVKFKGTSSLAMDIGFHADIYRWAGGEMKFSTMDSSSDQPFMFQLHLPICLMIRSGGEVILNPHPRFLFGIGVGFDPTFSGSQYLGESTGLFKIRSFLMLEVGVHAGIAWKLRFSYYPASLEYFNATGTGNMPADYAQNGNLTTIGNSSGNMVLSLILMPYSFHWGKESGY